MINTENIYNTLEYEQDNLYQTLNEMDVNKELNDRYGIAELDSDSIEHEVAFLYEDKLLWSG